MFSCASFQFSMSRLSVSSFTCFTFYFSQVCHWRHPFKRDVQGHCLSRHLALLLQSSHGCSRLQCLYIHIYRKRANERKMSCTYPVRNGLPRVAQPHHIFVSMCWVNLVLCSSAWCRISLACKACSRRLDQSTWPKSLLAEIGVWFARSNLWTWQ